MPNMNRIQIMGHLGKDPETRTTQNGKQCTTFSVATSNSYKKQDGTWADTPPDWHRVVCWGREADLAAEQFRKGDGVYIEGKISYREWEDQNGQKKITTEIVARTLSKLVPAPTSERRGQRPQQGGFIPPPAEEHLPF